MTAPLYDEVIQRLIAAGAGHPTGREHHVCFGTSGDLQVLDVWTNIEAFQDFADTLLPILRSLGIDPGQPRIEPTHNVIVPTAVSSA
jgi:hypothetical protein